MPQDPVRPEKGSLIVFSFGTFERLAATAGLGATAAAVTLVDPILAPQPRPGFLPDAAAFEHLRAVPGDSDGELALRSYSLRGLYSRAEATDELTALYPGLAETGRCRVAQTAASALLGALRALPAPLSVVIDMPGEEQRLLELLAQGGLLDRAETLVLRCGSAAFFAGAADAETLLAWLGARGFDLAETLDDDPDWPVLNLRADPAARRIAALEAALEATSRERDEARKQAEARSKAVAELRQAEGALTNERATLQQALDAATKLAADRKAALDLRTRERDEARAALAQRDARLGEAEERARAEQAARDQEARVGAETRSRLDVARTEIRRLEGQIELIKDLLLRQPGF